MSYEDQEDTNDILAEDVGMTLQELYAELLLKDELIITVETSQVDDIKAGLINVKAKENSKLRNKGVPVDNSKLKVIILKPTEATPAGFSRVHLLLEKRKTFNIALIETPSDL